MPAVPQHLIFWRHAEAEDVADAAPGSHRDLARELTRNGRRDAARVAGWIKTRLPKPRLVLSSPALRARQTALSLSDEPLLDPRLSPEHGVDAMLAALHEHADGCSTLVLVGHQPTLGRAALRWISGCDAAFALRKGGLVWVCNRERDDGNARLVRAVLDPSLLD